MEGNIVGQAPQSPIVVAVPLSLPMTSILPLHIQQHSSLCRLLTFLRHKTSRPTLFIFLFNQPPCHPTPPFPPYPLFTQLYYSSFILSSPRAPSTSATPLPPLYCPVFFSHFTLLSPFHFMYNFLLCFSHNVATVSFPLLKNYEMNLMHSRRRPGLFNSCFTQTARSSKTFSIKNNRAYTHAQTEGWRKIN